MSDVVVSWTEDRVARLKALVAGGHSASEIADALGGVSRNGVVGKAHRLGLSFGGGAGQVKPSNESRTLPGRLPTTPRAATANRPIAPLARPVPRPIVVLPSEPEVSPTPKHWPKPAGPEAVDLVGLKAGLCHLPLWGIEARSGLYCGKPVKAEGQRWCAACAQLVYERRPIRAQEELNAARARRAKQLSRDGAFA